MEDFSNYYDNYVKTNTRPLEKIYYADSIEHNANVLKVEKLMTSDPEAIILDAGCGIGNFVIPFAKKCKFVYGVDTSPLSIEICKERLKNENIKNFHVEVGHITSLPLPDKSVDKISCFSVLQYLDVEETKVLIKEFKRVLKSNGIIVLGFLNGDSPHGKTTKILRFFRQLIKGKKKYPSTNISFKLLKKIISGDAGTIELHHSAYFYPVLFPKRIIGWISKRFYFEKYLPKPLLNYGKSLLITIKFE